MKRNIIITIVHFPKKYYYYYNQLITVADDQKRLQDVYKEERRTQAHRSLKINFWET